MGKILSATRISIDTNLAFGDVVALKIFILGERFGAFEYLTTIKHHALSQRMSNQQVSERCDVYRRLEPHTFIRVIDSTYGFLR